MLVPFNGPCHLDHRAQLEHAAAASRAASGMIGKYLDAAVIMDKCYSILFISRKFIVRFEVE